MQTICEAKSGIIVMLRRDENSEDIIQAVKSADQPVSNKHTLRIMVLEHRYCVI